MSNYVIIGNGVAAVGCIEGIRSTDKSSAITVISNEPYPVYSRPLISYLIQGKTTTEKISYRSADFYESNNCEVLYQKKAISIDKQKKCVLLDDGVSLSYSSICVATGSSPFIPKIPGYENIKKKFSFMTLDDSLSLQNVLSGSDRVLIVGAGLIGLKCAECLCGRTKSITVCDLSPRILSSILDGECAAIMQKKLEENGIKFMLEDTVTEFVGNKAKMKSEKEIEFDILVMAVGVRANTSLVKDIGGNVNRGIIVNEKMETSLVDIYAAGDCTEVYDISSNSSKVIAILPNAYMQGYTAGVNMAGGNSVFDNSIPMNSIGFFGLHAITAGNSFNVDSETEIYKDDSNGNLKRLFIKNGLLTGYILIGNVDRAGIYTALIRNKVPLDTLDFELLKKNPTLSAYSKDERSKKLGGLV